MLSSLPVSLVGHSKEHGFHFRPLKRRPLIPLVVSFLSATEQLSSRQQLLGFDFKTRFPPN